MDLAGDLVAGDYAEDLGIDDTGRPSAGCLFHADPDVADLPGEGGYRLYANRTYRTVDTFPNYTNEDRGGLRRFDGEHTDVCELPDTDAPELGTVATPDEDRLPGPFDPDERTPGGLESLAESAGYDGPDVFPTAATTGAGELVDAGEPDGPYPTPATDAIPRRVDAELIRGVDPSLLGFADGGPRSVDRDFLRYAKWRGIH
jgi:hypothetical protein